MRAKLINETLIDSIRNAKKGLFQREKEPIEKKEPVILSKEDDEKIDKILNKIENCSNVNIQIPGYFGGSSNIIVKFDNYDLYIDIFDKIFAVYKGYALIFQTKLSQEKYKMVTKDLYAIKENKDSEIKRNIDKDFDDYLNNKY